MLAFMPASDVARILQAHGLPRASEQTIDTAKKLKAELERGRERGFAVDAEEHAVGLRRVAAAILDEDGRPLAALSISSPLARIDETAIGAMGGLVRRASQAITEQIGGNAKDRVDIVFAVLATSWNTVPTFLRPADRALLSTGVATGDPKTGRGRCLSWPR